MPKFDPNSWAEEQQAVRTSCRTCSMPEVAEAVRVVMKAIAEGRSLASLSRITAMLREHYDYPLKDGALRQHMANCEPELFKAVQERRNQ